MKPRSRVRLIALLLLAGGPLPAAAQDYPSRIDHRDRAVPGRRPERRGGAHRHRPHGRHARAIDMVIENVGGAGGTLGSARVAAAAPDGYTLLAGTMGSHVAAPVLTPNIKYDPARDFVPIGLDRPFAGSHRRAQGFPGQGLEGIRRRPEGKGQRHEAGARRHRLVVAHGVPAVHHGDRRQADAGGLSRHRART